MSIGIFGDSFARCKVPLMHPLDPSNIKTVIHTNDEYINFQQKVEALMPTWAKLLPDTTNFAAGGTDLSWSFLKFLEHHEKYDNIIFVVTSPKRITLNAPHMYVPSDRGSKFGVNLITSVSANQSLLKKEKFCNSVNEEHLYVRDAYDAINKWQTHIQPEFPERDFLHYGILINELQRIRPDIKLIKAFFDNSIKLIEFFDDILIKSNDFLITATKQIFFRNGLGILAKFENSLTNFSISLICLLIVSRYFSNSWLSVLNFILYFSRKLSIDN